MRWILASCCALALAAGCRVDAQLCDQACRNSAGLLYWRDADKAIAAAPADQRDALRKQKLGEFTAKLEAGINLCVSQCQSSRDRDGVECLAAAKTAEQTVACSQ